MFSPDGKKLAFSSNRRDVIGDKYRLTGAPAGARDTNVFVADWVDAPVHASRSGDDPSLPPAGVGASEPADRFAGMVSYLADDAREGRAVGTKGLEDAELTIQEQLVATASSPGPTARGARRSR